MIATISKQGGRRYPQMRSGWSAHVRLDSVGNAAVGATLVGQWANVIECRGNESRIEAHGNQSRIEVV